MRLIQNKTIPYFSILLLLFVGICASIIMFWVTNHAVGVSPDSTMYLETAENILLGNGFYARGEPITAAPPAYSLTLALVGFLYQGDVLQGARLLHVILFGFNTFLLGLTIQLSTKNSFLAISCVLLGFVSSPLIVSSHTMAWSDTLFISCFLLTFIALIWHITHPRWYSLVILAAIVGYSTLVRYVGITLIPPILVSIFLFSQDSKRDWLKKTAVVTMFTIAPLLIWLSRNVITGQSFAGRDHSLQFLGFHLDLLGLIYQLYLFVFPINWTVWFVLLQFFIGIGIIVGMALVLYKNRYLQQNFSSVPIILFVTYLLFLVTYLSFLIFSQLFLEVRNAWDPRILIPAFLAILVVAITLTWSLVDSTNKKIIRLAFLFIALTSISLNTTITIPHVRDLHANGSHYTARRWQNSKTIRALVSIHSEPVIYSNGPDAIRFLTRKEASMIPHHTPVGTRQPNLEYEQQLQAVCQEVQDGDAVLVYFEQIQFRWYLPTIEALKEACELPVLEELDDGVIFGSYFSFME